MSAVLEARAVITAEDKTGKAFDSVKARIEGINKVVGLMNRAMGSVEPVAKQVGAISGQIDKTSASMRQMGEAGRAVGNVASTIANVDRAAAKMAGSIGKTSAEVAGLSSKLMDAGKKLKAIGDFKGLSRAANDASLALQRAHQEERALAAKIDGVASPSRSMVAAHASALADVRATKAALTTQTEAVQSARTALAGMGVPLNQLRTEEERLRSTINGTNDALLRQIRIENEGAAAAEKAAQAQRRAGEAATAAGRAHAREAAAREAEIRHHGAMNFLAMGAAGVVSAHSIFEGIRETAHAGADYNHEVIGLQNAGRTPEKIAAIEKRSSDVVGKLPTSSFTENMKVIAETTGAFGSVEHAMEHLEFMQRTMSILKASGGEHIKGGVGEVGRALAKTFEERMTKPEEFEKEASAMIPAMVMSGGVFNPQSLYAFAQQAKSALPNYDMRFLSGIAPSIITAMGGDRAGTAANAFNSIIMGKANDKKQAEAWERFGLLDEKMVIKKAGHTTSWTAGAVKDTDLALRDPLEWAEKVALPAMEAKGVKIEDRLELAKVLGTMFRNQNSNMFANEMMQAASRARLHKDEALKDRTGTPEEIYERNRRDPTVQMTALKAALENLMMTMSNPLMGRAGLTMNAVARGMDSLALVMKEHPALAASAGIMAAGGALAGAGALSYQFMNGFGLGSSAAALTGSAGAIDAAAGRLGLAGLEHSLPGSLPGGRAAQTVERAVVREGEHLAEGAAEAAIGNKIVGAIEGGLKGGLAVEAVEIAAAAGVTLTAGSVAFIGLSAAAIIAALVHSSPPKHRAIDDPNYNKPMAPNGFDVNAPSLQDEDAKKFWFNRGVGHPRGPEPGHQDTSKPGHWALGRGGRAPHWVLDQAPRPLTDAPFFSIAPIGPDGRPTVAMPRGMSPNPMDPRSWARIGTNLPAPNPDLYSPANVPMPASVPGRVFAESRTKDDLTPLSRGGVVPVQIVGGAPPQAFHDGWMDGDRPGIEERSRRGAAMFRQDHEGTVGRHMMESESASPHIDTSGLDAASAKAQEASEHIAAIGAISVEPHVGSGQLDAIIAKAERAKALIASLGSGAPTGGGTSGSVGPSYPQTAPTGRMGGPR